MTELKPCPFCGGKAGLEQISDAYWVECGKCGASSVFCGQPEPAIDAWNTRADRTCHDETKPRDFFTCSECHTPIGKWVPVYCPKCGARVVSE